MDNSTNSSALDCVSNLEYIQFAALGGLVIAAIIILIILCFVQGRSHRKTSDKCSCQPGLAAPMSFLVSPRHRVIYIIIFGVMSTQALVLFNTIDIATIDEPYLNLFINTLIVPAVLVVILSMLYYPLFACADTRIRLIGHFLGFGYSIIWFFQYVLAGLVSNFFPTLCDPVMHPPDPRLIAVHVLTNLPIMAGSLFVVVWYFYQLIRDFIACCTKSTGEKHILTTLDGRLTPEIEERDDIIRNKQIVDRHVKRVRTLLSKPIEPPPPANKFYSILQKIKLQIYPYNYGEFRFPLAFAGAVVSMALLLYQLSFNLAFLGFIFISDVSVAYTQQVEPVLNRIIESFENSTFVHDTLVLTVDLINGVFIGVPVLLVLAPFISLIVCGVLLFHMVASVSKRMRVVAKRGIPKKLSSRFSRVPSSWKYVGYQIGFFVFAWIIYALLVVVAGVAAIVLVILLRSFTELIILFLLYLLVPLIWARSIFFLETVLSHFIFSSGKGKFMVINNRGLFNWFAYILFFYNGFAGFVGAIMRTLMASGFSLLLLFRLDAIVLMPGFEWLDYGHASYLGFLYLDSNYNNAVIHVFISILLHPNSFRPKQEPTSTLNTFGISAKQDNDDQAIFDKEHILNRRRAYSRWFLAYTLLKNPSLQKLRGAYLKLTAEHKTRRKNKTPVSQDVEQASGEEPEDCVSVISGVEDATPVTPPDGRTDEREYAVEVELNDLDSKPGDSLDSHTTNT